MTTLATLRIILVEPAGPLNVGSVARVMKNMGLQTLILVNPQCDPLGEQARQMAVHGLDVLEQARCVPTLAKALQGCQRAMATTAFSRNLHSPLEAPRQALPWLLEAEATSALIFGREDRGLSNEELNLAHRFVGIPANPAYASLNLAQAVAICAYELYQHSFQANALLPLAPETGQAPLEHLEAYYQHLETILLGIGVLYPHTAKARMAKLRRIYQRACPSTEEVALLRGILRQIDWIQQHLPPKPGQDA
ncbi:RNA methyltransferase [Synechocystis sp. LKSZ1]|uniref:RNA methyltransferase n=1 Tax=Synechocystis sp. LKSZ1 TaxID=3144951 RepID=UPI00336C252D